MRSVRSLWLKALCACFVTYAVLMTLPFDAKPFSAGLDESYMAALNVAFATNIQFGKDLVYTYGPYGLLHHFRYFPQTYHSVVLGRLFLGVVMGVGLWRIFAYCWQKHRHSCWFLLPLLFFFPNLHAQASMDAFCTVAIALPLLIYFYIERQSPPRLSQSQSQSQTQNRTQLSPILLLLIAGVALSSLIKHTFLVLGFAVAITASIDQILRRRKLPTFLIAYIAFTFGFWLLAGQSPQNIGIYLMTAAEATKGFSATMGLEGPAIEYILYLVAATSFLMLTAVATYRHRSRFDLLPIAILALILFLVFKSAFVRHDGHALHAVMTPVPVVCLYSAVLWPELKQIRWPLKRANTVVPLLLVAWVFWLLSSQFIFRAYEQVSYARYYADATFGMGKTLASASRWLLKEEGFRENAFASVYLSSAEEIQADHLLPPLAGTTDLYPNEPAVIFAEGLPYQPRPAMQSFFAYTRKLAEMNAAYLRKANAPETILFDVNAIDGRLPSSEDGLSWPELLSRYEIADMTGRFTVLKRRRSPDSYALTPLAQQTVTLQNWVDVPTEDTVWMQLDASPTLLGKLMTTLFRLPSLFIEAELADGSINRYRVLPEVMQAGQLLSPIVSDRIEFAYLAATDGQAALRNVAVRRMRLVTDGWGKWAYPKQYGLSFNRLDFPLQDLATVPGWSQFKGLIPIKSGKVTIDDNRPLENKVGSNGESVLLAHANTQIAVAIPEGAKSLSIGFGVLDKAWKEAAARGESQDVDGVEFRVFAVGAGGQLGDRSEAQSEAQSDGLSNEELLFARWLNPHTEPGDRGEKTAVVPLPATLTDASADVSADVSLKGRSPRFVVLETYEGPNDSNGWDHSYWSRLTFN